jgi:hypothetical protein
MQWKGNENLNDMLAHRPGKDELVEKNILKAGVEGKLGGITKQLQEAQLKGTFNVAH